MANLLQGMRQFGQESGLGDIAKLLVQASQETKHPGYLQRQQSLDMAQNAQDLDAQFGILRSLEPGSEAFNAALESLRKHPVIGQLISQIQGKNMKSANAPYGVDDKKIAEFNNATVNAGIQQAGAKVDPLDQPKVTLADMLGDKPQNTTRKGWWIFGDDTISPQSVKVATDDYVKRLQLDEGLSRDEARKRAAMEYDELQANDTGSLQRYPKMDVARLFADSDTRKEAVQTGQTVVDTGDGVQTTPKKMADVGIGDVNTQEQFQTLEGMVSKALPDMDLRADYQKDPQFYQQLFKAIKEGVPDGKGGKRKLSTDEIVKLIKGE